MSDNPLLAVCPYLTDAASRQFLIAAPIFTLGRLAGSGIFIADRRASRRHAEVRYDGEGCTLHDLDSANGTFLNGDRIAAPADLHDGDEIGIAGAMFTFHDPDATLRERDFPMLAVDDRTGQIRVNRRPIALSQKEQALFDLLYRNAGRLCDKQHIAEAVWPEYQAEVFDYQIESLVKRLREKIDPDPAHPVLVVTVRGRGYQLVNRA